MNLTQYQFLLPLLLPVPIAFLAGLLRQDKFKPIFNEVIAWVLVFLISLVSVAFGVGGHLTGNAQLDFLTITTYSGLLAHSKLLYPMQTYLQSNLLSLGVSEASKLEQIGLNDIKASVDGLIAFLGNAGVGQQAQQAPAPQQQAHVAQAVQQVPFPAQTPIPYQPQAWTAPWLQAMPTPPKG